MEQSILKSTKNKLNVAPDDPSFDAEIVDHINTAFSHLHQLGIGPQDGFQIEGEDETWENFLPAAKIPVLNQLKTCIHLRARSLFDPPQLPHVMTAMQNQLLEADTRLNIMREETAWVDPDPTVTVIDESA